MEGPCIRRYPRMVLDKPVEADTKETQVRASSGNVSAGGVFIPAADLPVGTSVHIRLEGGSGFEATGVVCHHDGNGVGIAFTETQPDKLYAVIEDLTRRGLPAC
jgi:hypothetical protein